MKKLVVLLVLLAGLWQGAAGQVAIVDTVWLRTTWDITSISFHPNSEIIAVGNQGKYVGIWDVKTGTEIQKYKQGGVPWTCFFSQSGKLIVYGGNSGYFIRNFDNDSLVFSYSSPAVVALSKDERYFATAINNNSLILWDLQTGEKLIELDSIIKNDPKPTRVSYIDFSPDGTHIACGTYHSAPNSNNTLVFIRLSDMKIDYVCPLGAYFNFKYSHDGTKIAYSSPDSGEAIKIMDVNTKQIVATIPGVAQGVGQMVFSTDDKYLIYTYGQIIVWDLENKTKLKNYPGGYKYLSVSNNNKYIASNISNDLYLLNFLKGESVTENNNISATLLFPNPTNATLNLTFNLVQANQTDINIYGLDGQIVKGIENNYLLEGTHTYTINLTELPNGSYYLKINSGKYSFSQSFIINK